MEYSLFQDKEEIVEEKMKEKQKYTNINEKMLTTIFIAFLMLLSLFFFLSLFYRESESISLEFNVNNEIISFINKRNNSIAKKYSSNGWSWYNLKEFIPDFQDIVVSLYDFVIPSKFNSSNIINLFNNLTSNTFDIDNYIKIKDFCGLDVSLTSVVTSGILVINFIIDTVGVEIKFDKKLLLKFSNVNALSLSFKLLAFLTFSIIFNYCDNFSIEKMKSFIYELYNSIQNYIKNSGIVNKGFSFNLR